MSLTLSAILYLLAFIAFVLAAIGWTYRKTDLIAIGLALFTLAMLLPGLSSFGVKTLLLVLSFLAFVAAAVGWRYRKINLIAVGLALYMLSLIL